MMNRTPWFILSLDGVSMKRVNLYDFYQLGAELHPLRMIVKDTTVGDNLIPLMSAGRWLPMLLSQELIPLRISRQACGKLNEAIQVMLPEKYVKEEMEKRLEWATHSRIINAISGLETVLAAELPTLNTYLIEARRGYDTDDLIANGTVLFPADLPTKVPEAIQDVKDATRCIAFELPTAAGFHLHRASESVLRKYYDAVTKGAARPSGRNIGDYLNALQNANAGKPVVLAALRDLKDLHRNPLIHPEHSLESVDDAIALLGSVQAVVVHMLKEIP